MSLDPRQIHLWPPPRVLKARTEEDIYAVAPEADVALGFEEFLADREAKTKVEAALAVLVAKANADAAYEAEEAAFIQKVAAAAAGQVTLSQPQPVINVTLSPEFTIVDSDADADE